MDTTDYKENIVELMQELKKQLDVARAALAEAMAVYNALDEIVS